MSFTLDKLHSSLKTALRDVFQKKAIRQKDDLALAAIVGMIQKDHC